MPLLEEILKSKMASCYTIDIVNYWKCKESQRQIFGFRSPQLSFRDDLVHWINKVSQMTSFSCRTLHLAIYILDSFMDNHSVTKDRLTFLALVCLMLAAKFEEADSKMPKISKLIEYNESRYSNKEFIKLEVCVLKFIDFELMQPTVAHFAEFYESLVVLPTDLRYLRRSQNSLFEIVNAVFSELVEVSLMEVQLLRLPPSKVAATCVLCARRLINLVPAWTPVHISFTGYAEDSLAHCALLLMEKLGNPFQKRQRQGVYNRQIIGIFPIDE